MTVELLGSVTPIHMVGESHSLVFSNLLFRPEGSEETYLCRTRFLPTLLAGQYCDGSDLDPGFVEALIGEGIVDAELRPAFLHAEPSAAFLIGKPVLSPPIVLFAGDLDINKLFRQIGDGFDFVLPDDPHYGASEILQNIPYGEVERQIAGFLTPFCQAVATLRSVGFSRMMVHCLPPRTPDNQAAAEWTGGVVIDAPVRAKLTLLANRLLAEFCAEAEIAFIDTWPELTEGGYLRPEFELDGTHLNRASALISLDKIAAHLFDHTAGIWNGTRYGHAAKQAERWRPEIDYPDYARQWAQAGLLCGNAGAALALKLKDGLSYTVMDGNPLARPDWIGRPRAGIPGIALAEPSAELLAEAADVLGEGEALAMLQMGSNRELTVASFRPVRYAAGASDIEPLPSPAGTRRAVLFLAASDRLVFETLDGQAIPCPPFDAGSLIVYDPEQVRPGLAAGAEDLEIVELGLMPRLSGEPFRLVWAGLCDWPADPFAYSVAGMKAAPPFAGPSFRARSKR